MRSRAIAFAALAVVCVAAAVTAGALAVVGAHNDRKAANKAVAADAPKAGEILASGKPFVAFRLVDRSHASMYGRMAVATLDGGKPGTPTLAGPACARIAVGANRGLCLDLLGTQMAVDVLDARLKTVHRFELAGIPSRARISPDGRWGGVTAFVVGHAYATLAAGPRTWLIKGSIKARKAHTIHENVECPSLSPDGTRIGYKKAVGHDPTVWRFHVLDLATGRETPLSETRSVDDQLAWLDNQHLLYSDKEATWMVNADGTGKPQEWLAASDSPTVQEAPTASP